MTGSAGTRARSPGVGPVDALPAPAPPGVGAGGKAPGDLRARLQVEIVVALPGQAAG